MEQYISKSALVAEIERKMNLCKQILLRSRTRQDDDYHQGNIEAYEVVISLLDTLEVKEVGEEPTSNDLEEAVKKYLTSLRKSHFEGYDIERAFKKGAKWQKEQMIDWLKENKEHPLIGCEDPCLSGYLTDRFIEEFKKAMEE